MARKKQSRGHCEYCNREMTKGGLAKHLRSCVKRKEAITQGNKGKGSDETIFHLQVQDAWATDFWLHLEMQGRATLKNLDTYLRAIWLECCGHLSAFHIGPHRYTQIFDDGWGMDDAKPMDVPAQQLLSSGMKIPYEYDFGTTSELIIKVVDARRGKALTANPIVLMARNLQPKTACMECDQPSDWLCMECLYEYDEPGYLCDEHVDKHPHDSYGEPVPVLNSPRVGLCGYTGPAEPPY